MKRFFATAIAVCFLAAPTGTAFAQPRPNNYGHTMHGPAMYSDRQADWRENSRTARNDWNRDRHADYRNQYVRTPSRGYEMREDNGNYIFAAAAVGLIAAIMMSNR
jgi:Ni/Co efflux regulator RcnB